MARPAEAIQQFSLRSVSLFFAIYHDLCLPFCLLLFISEIFQRDFLLRLKIPGDFPFCDCLCFVFYRSSNRDGLDHGCRSRTRFSRKINTVFIFGIFWVAAKYEHQESYINSFVAGLFLCSILAHYNYLYFFISRNTPEGILSGKRNGMETAPFLSHVMYSPILAVGVYLVLRQLLIPTDIFKLKFLSQESLYS